MGTVSTFGRPWKSSFSRLIDRTPALTCHPYPCKGILPATSHLTSLPPNSETDDRNVSFARQNTSNGRINPDES